MPYRTAVLSDFESYLASEYPDSVPDSAAAVHEERTNQNLRLQRFPFSVVLQVSYPELDFANRWCWQAFGPASGQCLDNQSQYPSCKLAHPHEHEGAWSTHWLAKTDYDFGYNEWSFAQEEDRDRFLQFVPEIHWGERFPK